MGTDNAARNPRRRARSRLCGLGSACASEILIADRSKMQRPANTAASGRIGYWFRRNCSVSGRAPRAAPKCSSSPSNRVTKTDHASSRLIARSATASSTGCTSRGELAMTFNISAVAACCSRASFRSLLGSETERRLTRVAAGAMRRLVLAVLRPFAGLALRAFASLVLPPVLDGRAISAPRVKKGILSG